MSKEGLELMRCYCRDIGSSPPDGQDLPVYSRGCPLVSRCRSRMSSTEVNDLLFLIERLNTRMGGNDVEIRRAID